MLDRPVPLRQRPPRPPQPALRRLGAAVPMEGLRQADKRWGEGAAGEVGQPMGDDLEEGEGEVVKKEAKDVMKMLR